ncbi:MAG TPA: tyrosine-type recombinase/integrase [Candidatus Acidoferrales bacterium]|nr:tyrosine-type recombinase/integrase [Candidatus Acidoferrales bacterium]
MDTELALVNDYRRQPKTTITFRQQAAVWVAECQRRRARRIKPGVIALRQSVLKNHVLPVLGDLPLCDVKNGAMRTLVERLAAKGLKPSSIQTSCGVVKSVVASLENSDGDPIFGVVWNKKFAPVINPTAQNRPTFTTEELQTLINKITGRLQMAVVLLAASGLRIGELLGLECKHFADGALRIEQAAWRGKIQTPKTANAYRTVELHPAVAALLRGFIGDRQSGYIFTTRSGHPIGTRNFLRLLYASLKQLGFRQRGFHAFRRFRNTYLRKQSCPPGLLRYWMGHSARSMSDVYDRSFEDAAFRREVANAVGVGFEVPERLGMKERKQLTQPEDRALMGVRVEATRVLSC